jgi:transposase
MTTDAKGRPIGMFLSAGHRSNDLGAAALLSSFPHAKALIADRTYDADWFRWALAEWSIEPCIPSCKGRKISIPHDAALYRQRHRIENMFARHKDWRSIATRYDRCAKVFLSACALAAVVLIWLSLEALISSSCLIFANSPACAGRRPTRSERPDDRQIAIKHTKPERQECRVTDPVAPPPPQLRCAAPPRSQRERRPRRR